MGPRENKKRISRRPPMVVLLSLGMSIGAIGCASTSDATEPSSDPEAATLDTSFSASPETRAELGIEKWSISRSPMNDGAVVTVTGDDGAGAHRAAFEVGMSDPAAAEGVVILSIEGMRADARWNADGQVTTRGFEELRNQPSIAATLKQYVADHPSAPSSGVQTSALQIRNVSLVKGGGLPTEHPYWGCMDELVAMNATQASVSAMQQICRGMHGAP